MFCWWWPFLLTTICHLLALIRPTNSATSSTGGGGRRGQAADALVKKYDILTDCVPGEKNVRKLNGFLGSAAAIFHLNETEYKGQKASLFDDEGYYDCHYELEASENHGFHIYIDQMNLNEHGSKKDECEDYVHFGR